MGPLGHRSTEALRAGGIAGRGVLGRREGGKVGQGTARNAQRAGGRVDVVEFCRAVSREGRFVDELRCDNRTAMLLCVCGCQRAMRGAMAACASWPRLYEGARKVPRNSACRLSMLISLSQTYNGGGGVPRECSGTSSLAPQHVSQYTHHLQQGKIALLIRMPEGKRLGRKFRKTESVEQLYSFVDAALLEAEAEVG